MLRATSFAIPFMLLILAGCAPSTDPDTKADIDNKSEGDNAEGTTTADNSEKSATPDEDITVEFMAWKDTEKLIEGNKGKVVVIDLWHQY